MEGHQGRGKVVGRAPDLGRCRREAAARRPAPSPRRRTNRRVALTWTGGERPSCRSKPPRFLQRRGEGASQDHRRSTHDSDFASALVAAAVQQHEERSSSTRKLATSRPVPRAGTAAARGLGDRARADGQQPVDEHQPMPGTGPTARCRGRSANRASRCACQRGPSSATNSANTSRDSPVTRRSATAAARARLLATPRPCPVPHEQADPPTRHEIVSAATGLTSCGPAAVTQW